MKIVCFGLLISIAFASAGFLPVIDNTGNLVYNNNAVVGITGRNNNVVSSNIGAFTGIQQQTNLQNIPTSEEVKELQRSQQTQPASISYSPTITPTPALIFPIPNNPIFITPAAAFPGALNNVHQSSTGSFSIASASSSPTGGITFSPSNAFGNAQTINAQYSGFGAGATAAAVSSHGTGNFAAAGPSIIGFPFNSGSIFTSAGGLPLFQAGITNNNNAIPLLISNENNNNNHSN